MTAFTELPLRQVASTNGGELAGPCPFCGGDDRFRAWPDSGDSGRWWCRSCDRKGDGLQLLIDLHGMTYRQACDHLALETRRQTPSTSFAPPKWKPTPANYPSTAWQEMAAKITNRAATLLQQHRETLTWLKQERGLTPATIEKSRLGLIPKDCWFDRKSWGLEPGKKIWLPVGLLIPCLAADGAVVRLRVRRHKPGDGQRYIVAAGGYSGAAGWNLDRQTALIVESELDGLLCKQTPIDVGVIAMTTAAAKPPAGLHEILEGKHRLLVALDNDEAGEKAAAWWLKQYSSAVRLAPIKKDPGEMYQAQMNLDLWIKSGGSLNG